MAERQADRGERGPERREPVGQCRAEVQRSLHRVLARLVDGDAVRELGFGARGGGAREVERLADAQLDAQLVEHDVRGVGHAAHEDVGVGEREVADEDRHALAEPAGLAPPTGADVTLREARVHRVVPAAHLGAVHDVVVRERERVHELERGRGVDDPRVAPVALRTDERAVAEGRTEPLAAGGDEAAQCFDRLGQPGVDRAPPGELRPRADRRSGVPPASRTGPAPWGTRPPSARSRSRSDGSRTGGETGTRPAYAATVPEFLSEMWLDELDRAVRASAACPALAPIVIEQVVHDVPGRGRGPLPDPCRRRRGACHRRRTSGAARTCA